MKDKGHWIKHPLHPTRARLQGQTLTLEQTLSRRLRVGPLLSTAVMALLERYTSWDGDEDNDTFWSVAFTVMGDWDARARGPLELVRGGDGRPGLRRGRKEGRIRHDLACAWRGTRQAEPWLDTSSTGVIPLVLHYQPVADLYPALWAEVRAMAQEALERLAGRRAYQLARVLGALGEPGPHCAWCGSQEQLTFDHGHSLDKGGHPWGDNLLTACRACNQRKGALALEQWLAQSPPPTEPARVQRAWESLGSPRPALTVPLWPPGQRPAP